MKTLLKNELKRMFGSKEMLGALVIGTAISIWYAVQYIWTRDVYEKGFSYCPESVFYNWLGAFSFPAQSFLYYLILPLLAVLPGGATYYEDIKSQYTANIYTRCSKRKYLLAKYIAVFLSGGTVFVLPLILSLLISMSHFPMLIPEAIIDIGPSQTAVLHTLYFTHPWVYVAIYLCIDFLFAGGTATVALAVTHHMDYKFGVILMPFVVYFGIYCINNVIGGLNYAPNYFLISGMGDNNIWEFLISGAVFAGIFIYYWVRGMKYEVS